MPTVLLIHSQEIVEPLSIVSSCEVELILGSQKTKYDRRGTSPICLLWIT